MLRFVVPVVASCLLFLAGCGGGDAKNASGNAAEQQPPLAGEYLLVISQRSQQQGYVDIYAARLEFPAQSGGSIRLQGATDAFPSPELVESSAEGGKVRLAFDSAGGRVEFEGKLARDGAWGSFCVGGLQCVPARLVPAAGSDFSDESFVQRAEGAAELEQLQRGRADFEDLVGFCRRNPKSPAVIDVYAELIPYLGALEFNEEQVRDFTRDYIKAASRWGERMAQIAQINVGYGLVITEHLPELGLKYLHDSEKKLPPPQAEQVQALLRRAEELIDRGKARDLIAAGETDQAVELLEPMRQKYPFDPLVTQLLAVAAEKAGQTERALELYGEIVALPGSQRMLVNSPGWNREDDLPQETLQRLWEKARGTADGLSEFLDEVYIKAVSQIATPAEEVAGGGGDRVVLGELFTGAQCQPCIAADVASMALEATYPRSKLIVLRYHQNSPAEDPLTNTHTQERFEYYRERGQQQGTPTFIVSGQRVTPGVGGPLLSMAPDVYQTLRKQIDPLLSGDAGLTIELSAVDRDGQLSLQAAVEGGEVSEYLRLRLALAEDDLSFDAANGIRKHRLIVRHMPGGPRGIAPTDGRLAFEGTLTIEELRNRLLDELQQYERTLKVRFPTKPVELKPLYFVAYVQDERTKEIVQAAGIPVAGH